MMDVMLTVLLCVAALNAATARHLQRGDAEIEAVVARWMRALDDEFERFAADTELLVSKLSVAVENNNEIVSRALAAIPQILED